MTEYLSYVCDESLRVQPHSLIWVESTDEKIHPHTILEREMTLRKLHFVPTLEKIWVLGDDATIVPVTRKTLVGATLCEFFRLEDEGFSKESYDSFKERCMNIRPAFYEEVLHHICLYVRAENLLRENSPMEYLGI